MVSKRKIKNNEKSAFKKQNNTWVLDKKEVNGGSCG